MSPDLNMHHQIISSVFRTDAAQNSSPPDVTGDGAFGGVSALAVSAVSAAVEATQLFCKDVFHSCPAAAIDKGLVDLWCTTSFLPDGWRMPPAWDEFSCDFQARQGWLRLHTNAPHHRRAALSVLKTATTLSEARAAIQAQDAAELVETIVQAGGCAAQLFTSDAWRSHPQGLAVANEPVVAWTETSTTASEWIPRGILHPLEGLRVLDLTRIIAGPVATRFLASLGADVLRIDPLGWSEGGNEVEMSLGKTCAELDLTLEKDRMHFETLIKSAHALVHGYRQDALHGLGFGTDRLAELNPGLITVGLTAYGWTGPWAFRRGFDSLVQRSTGLAVERDGKVIDLPYQVLDHATGYVMAASVLEALRRQVTENLVSHARLSLARQAMLLLEMGVNAGNVASHALDDQRLAAAQQAACETTPWGPGRRLPLPYQIPACEPGWARGARRLRSDPPRWRSLADEAA